MDITNNNLLATFQRQHDERKLCRSELLDCNICFDTGSGIDIIPRPLLKQIVQRGFVVEDAEGPTTFTPSDGVPISFECCKRLTLPLSPIHWYRSVFRVSKEVDGRNPYMMIGRKLLARYVIQYTKESVNILNECPEEYQNKLLLEKDDGRYYVMLSVNGREHRCYLDTGHSDPITLPVSESVFAISPIHEIEDNLIIFGRAKKVVDLEEERCCLQIGGITRHGPIVYADYYDQPYWFNPTKIFWDFVIDLKGKYIAFKQK